MIDEEETFSLSPINFFQISAPCHYVDGFLNPRNFSKFLLPDTSTLTGEQHFADLALAWNHEGISALVDVKVPFKHVEMPNVTKGDSIELFFDTRDVKTSGYNTRFCHHFFFLPELIEGVAAGEITRFRTEDVHELCNGQDLQVKAQMSRNYYTVNIFIPTQCLYGYDPDQFDRLGFTYRINRSHGSAQHFSVLTEEYQLEQQPSLWSSLRLVK